MAIAGGERDPSDQEGGFLVSVASQSAECTHTAVRESDPHQPFRHRPARVARFVPSEMALASFAGYIQT